MINEIESDNIVIIRIDRGSREFRDHLSEPIRLSRTAIKNDVANFLEAGHSGKPRTSTQFRTYASIVDLLFYGAYYIDPTQKKPVKNSEPFAATYVEYKWVRFYPLLRELLRNQRPYWRLNPELESLYRVLQELNEKVPGHTAILPPLENAQFEHGAFVRLVMQQTIHRLWTTSFRTMSDCRHKTLNKQAMSADLTFCAFLHNFISIQSLRVEFEMKAPETIGHQFLSHQSSDGHLKAFISCKQKLINALRKSPFDTTAVKYMCRIDFSDVRGYVLSMTLFTPTSHANLCHQVADYLRKKWTSIANRPNASSISNYGHLHSGYLRLINKTHSLDDPCSVRHLREYIYAQYYQESLVRIHAEFSFRSSSHSELEGVKQRDRVIDIGLRDGISAYVRQGSWTQENRKVHKNSFRLAEQISYDEIMKTAVTIGVLNLHESRKDPRRKMRDRRIKSPP